MKLSKNYEPTEYEPKIYALWEEKNAFSPQKRGSDDYYSVVIPPPNANGDLHIGHALTLALEDIAIRYQRMQGKAVLFVPGADHAGFETQSVYEKRLAEAGKSRFDFSREELYSQIWNFVGENRGNYEKQFRKLGASLDWSRFTYTLDQKIIDRAYETFKKLWEDGLIYRGERLVNYCTFHGTGFADVEVEYEEKNGHIWNIRYPLSDGSGEVIVATTRPETMLGDTAVAVHPEDIRYQHLIGKTIKLPLTQREIPILADEFVDRSFGTGAVKITPAHDPNDYEVAKRHDLPMITVIGYDGKINHNAPENYLGLSVLEARERVVADLSDLGLIAKTKEHINSVGKCYKCDTIIEPLLKEQWFVDMKPLAERAIGELKGGKIKFFPNAKKHQLITYLENLRDWNISRQIAWGIPIPAFQNIDDVNDWIFDTRVDEKIIEIDGKQYHRDPDVFDTWFSSSSWPYATLDFPDGDDFKQFYPLSLMETGGEILYPWVSRMIMLGLYVTADIPFKEVYVHGYVMAEDGSKMSKSVGNVVNPMPVIDEFGSDALRMGIVAGRAPAVNRGYDPRRVEEARNFCNKIWNIARFIEGTLGDELSTHYEVKPQSIADELIIYHLNEVGKSIGNHLENYEFSEGYEELYHLIWDDIADWYIEASKLQKNTSVLNYVLQTMLKIAHPYAPFLTEAIWQTIYDEDSLIITSPWPKKANYNQDRAKDFREIKNIVTGVRQIKALLKIQKGTLAYAGDEFIDQNKELITHLAKLDSVEISDSREGIALTTTLKDCWYVVDGETAKKLIDSLTAKKVDLENQINRLNERLANKNYVEKAPEHLIDQTKSELELSQSELQKITQQITDVQS